MIPDFGTAFRLAGLYPPGLVHAAIDCVDHENVRSTQFTYMLDGVVVSEIRGRAVLAESVRWQLPPGCCVYRDSESKWWARDVPSSDFNWCIGPYDSEIEALFHAAKWCGMMDAPKAAVGGGE